MHHLPWFFKRHGKSSGTSDRRAEGSRGINGDRPPVLKPPPAMTLPPVDDMASTWDLLKSLGPGSEVGRGFDSDDEEAGGREDVGEPGGVEVERTDRSGGGSVLSDSCSVTTWSDDDGSSCTTEPLSIFPPITGLIKGENMRVPSVITGWLEGEFLGSGSFGTVYEGIAEDGFFFAVKEVSLLDQGSQGRQSIMQLEQEIALLSQFEHENIVQYYGTDKDESKLYIFLELVSQGSLTSLYHRYRLRDTQVSAYTRQILHGLKYLHDRNVVHRDIKCANILVDTNGFVKLADFGVAKFTKLNVVKSVNSAFWMAPEVVKRKTQVYGLPADIWSLGCTVLEMLTCQLPYSELNPYQAIYRISRGVPPAVPESLSHDARDFVLQCLKVDPAARPTAAQLLDHPFVRRPLSLSLGRSRDVGCSQGRQSIMQLEQITMNQEPSVFVSSRSRWKKLAICVRFIINCLRRFRAINPPNKLPDIINSVKDLDSETCGPEPSQHGMHQFLEELTSQSYPWAATSIGIPILSGRRSICISSGAEKEPVHCRRLKNFSLKMVNDQLSLSCLAGGLPEQSLRDLIDLLLVLYPSRPLALNLRAECLVEVYLPGSNDPLLQDLVNLKKLDLSYSSFARMPDLSGAYKLQSLVLHGCNNLVDASSIQYLTKLECINLKGCTSLMRLPSLMALKLLGSLDVCDCKNLRRLPPSLGYLSSLTTLDVRNCKKIWNIPRCILRLKSLKSLSISGCSMLMECMSQVETSASTNPILLNPSSFQSGAEARLIEFRGNQMEYSSLHTADEELSSMYQPISNYLSKISLQQPNEGRMCCDSMIPSLEGTSYVTEKSAGSEDSTTKDLELIPACLSVTAQPSLSRDNSNVNFTLDSFAQYGEALKGYMKMQVEDIHEANAYYDIQRTVRSLIRQSSDSSECACPEDLLYFWEELQESVPETMAQLRDAQHCITSFLARLELLGLSFVEAEKQYNLLAAKLLVISKEEEELDEEMRHLLTKRQELLDE